MREPITIGPGSAAELILPLPNEVAAPLPLTPAAGLRADVGLTLVLVPLTVILCCSWGVRPNLDVQPYAYAMTCVVLFSMAPTLVLFLVAALLGLTGTAPGLTRLSTAGFLRNCALLTVMSWVYTHLKAGALLGATWDELLLNCDRVLLGGGDAWTLCRAVVPEAGAELLAAVYALFLPFIVGCILWLTLTGRTQTADALTCSIVLGYYAGAFAYHIVPAYGPAYVAADAHAGRLSELMGFLQNLILQDTRSVQANPGNAVVLPWRYIAAFPSLHFSHVLILTWYMRYHRLGLLVTAVFSLLTAVSTIYFGWHYLADLFGGAALAGLVLWVTVPRSAGTWWRLRAPSGGSGQPAGAGEVEVAAG